jgi:hypothetical protein
MDRAGLSPYGQEDEAVRWVAVRHGQDHIHIVAMLARQDGGKPSLSWERYKVRATCLAAEQCYGLRSTAPADRTAARRPTRAEDEKAARRGRAVPGRLTTAATSPAAQQRRAARRSVVPQASQGRPPATRTRSAQPSPERPDAATSAAATTATRP